MSEIDKNQAHMPPRYVDFAEGDADLRALTAELPDELLEACSHTGFDGPAEGYPAPPERVRFCVPAKLSFDGYDDVFDVTIVNLSLHGVACTGPLGLSVGERLRLDFRLQLTQAPQQFCCDVRWVRGFGRDMASYGMAFIDTAPEQQAQLQQVVCERAEGRAAEWPLHNLALTPAPQQALPAVVEAVMPLPTKSSGLARLYGAIGLLVGLGSGLLLGSMYQATPVVAPAMVEAAPAIEAPKAPVIEAVPEVPTAAINVDDAVDLDTKPSVKKTPERKKPAARVRLLDGLRVEEQEGKITLTLPLDGIVRQHHAFWLNHPQRVVLDVPGRQSKLLRKVVEIGHPLVQRVRVGAHAGKVRFVIETGPSVVQDVVPIHQGDKIRLEFHL